MKTLMARYKASHIGRMMTRYGQRSGAVLAGGVAYAALFSAFGALVAAFSVFGLALGSNEALFDQVVKATAEALPGLLKVDGAGGAIDPKTLVQSDLFSTTGAIAFLTSLFAGLGWVDALRSGVRAMFDIPQYQGNVVVQKLQDVLWLACLGLTLLASALLSMGLSSVGGVVLDTIGLHGGFVQFAVRGGGFLIVVLIETIVLFIVFRWLAGLRLPLVRLRGPLLVGGVGLAILTQFSGVFIGSAGTKNSLLATGAALVALLVLFNFISRLILYVAAWIASLEDPYLVHEFGPAPALDLGKDLEPTAPERPTVSVRAQDRVVAAAGVVLGVAVAMAGRVVLDGVASLRQLVGRH